MYVKIHVKTNQGVQNFTAAAAQTVAGEDPDHQTRSLFDDLEAGKTPSWDVYAQIIDPKKAANYPINIFDATKTLPFEDFPLRKFGRIVLNKNPDDSFAEVEQSAFSPTNIVPGWALSPDPSKSSFHKKPMDLSLNFLFSFSPANSFIGICGHAETSSWRELHPATNQQAGAQLQPADA